ncbi:MULTISPECIES: cytochrome C [Dyadobacter]|uniref:Cytochrome C n=2 Tax=Dyadobacter TaxID=120831 RepID=A0A9X1T8M8_9BACT|nr:MULTISPECIES: cytochrome C [Dyadobacter]MCF0040355.1 cytochrome C [Dyadobacter fanqingshengii]MCF2494823.1 cytochrome C [Dyadobacter chenhuakuii]MCF2502157.1 cytochrome C [Dyadobacter fanqingshengii]MCF2519098.1 cytochrome C [Dyadobacter sp. CY351]USJ31857.1 cytochrome C [Dyadobacter chenhuakuii]
MEDKSTVFLFLDQDQTPIAEFLSPVNFELDTRKMVDGKHELKIISKDPTGKEGIRIIPFEVKNGPAIAVEGIAENAVVDGIVPLMINAYGKGDQKRFLITGSETPQSIPAWIWILLIGFLGWSIYYLIRYINLVTI